MTIQDRMEIMHMAVSMAGFNSFQSDLGKEPNIDTVIMIYKKLINELNS